MDQSSFSDRKAFEEVVSALLDTNAGGSFGKLHLVTIAPPDGDGALPVALGKAVSIAESILHARLAFDDACLTVAPGQYMLLFPRLSEREGVVRAAAIAREIRERLFGQTQGTLDVKVQVLPLSRLRPRQAATAVEAMDNVLSRHAKQAGIDLDVVFQPVWSGRDQAIIGNRARIRRHFNGYEMFESAILFGGEQDPLAVDAGRILREAATRAKGKGGVLFLPQAINDHALTDETEIARDVARLVRDLGRDVVIELSGAVASLPRPRLRNVVSTILKAGARVAIRTIPELDTARFYRECGVSFICLNEVQIQLAGLTATAILALFTVVAHEVQGLGFEMCLWNTPLAHEVKRAVGLGFSLFTGPVIGPNAGLPQSPQPWPTYKVFS